MNNCQKFQFCSAPLCPMIDNKDIWYPDEEICSLREFSHFPWIRNQKKLARKAKEGFYFTPRMLEHNCKITQGIKGLNPDKDLSTMESDEKKWLKEHPEKKELTEEEKKAFRERIQASKKNR